MKKVAKPGKVRQFTDDEKAVKRARLLVGQGAAKKRRESTSEPIPDKSETTKTKKSKKVTELVQSPDQNDQ
jgi:hypothetical protein